MGCPCESRRGEVSPPPSTRARLPGVWLGDAPLVVLALVAAGGRAIALATGTEPFAAVYGLFPHGAVHDARILDRWFAAHAPLTWTHILTGSLILALTPSSLPSGSAGVTFDFTAGPGAWCCLPSHRQRSLASPSRRSRHLGAASRYQRS